MMRRMRSAWERTPAWLGRGRGATAAEYMVLLMLAALFIVAMIRVFGSSVTSKFEASRQEISGISSEDRGTSAAGQGAAGANNGEQRSMTRTTVAAAATNSAAAEARARGERPQARWWSVGGVSWIVVAIVLGLFGLLGYVIFGGKKE
ncbi:hypothetical protein FRC98_00745 [Lujinxingia vulgaris]|uniref:Flp family type IVb pilin n=1 Tax=Lujinxingia vulgaris TaxID=2600176 RepID=A0A5C6XC20_9DELT|nr:hypothetical protein [Lujinxingia vulgaris]TXD38961.1 hypothetical protein FRC98_00745 [Lujinxingia vulgaris]